jgi:hypothetical protein
MQYNENLVSTKIFVSVLAKHSKGNRMKVAVEALKRLESQKSITPIQAKWIIKCCDEYEFPIPFDLLEVLERGYLPAQKAAELEVRERYLKENPNDLFDF